MENSKGVPGNSIDQQVIDFTANYVGMDPGKIDDATVLSSIGIVTPEEETRYVMELEAYFGIQYTQGDQDGIITVGNATTLIEEKLGEAAAGK